MRRSSGAFEDGWTISSFSVETDAKGNPQTWALCVSPDGKQQKQIGTKLLRVDTETTRNIEHYKAALATPAASAPVGVPETGTGEKKSRVPVEDQPMVDDIKRRIQSARSVTEMRQVIQTIQQECLQRLPIGTSETDLPRFINYVAGAVTVELDGETFGFRVNQTPLPNSEYVYSVISASPNIEKGLRLFFLEEGK